MMGNKVDTDKMDAEFIKNQTEFTVSVCKEL